MSNATVAGKPSNIIGDQYSQLILRGSSIRVQWGNRFIDLIKNGKIAIEEQEIFKTANSEEELNKDGIYKINEEIYIVISGIKFKLSQENDSSYISISSKQELTEEQKNTVLSNMGLYYETLSDLKNSNSISGIAYVHETNKIYTINNGQIQEYFPNIEQQDLRIFENKIFLKDIEYIVCENDDILFKKYLKYDSSLQNIKSEYINIIPNINWVNQTLNEHIPSGVIVMWSGTTIPNNWRLCDGTDGTPDLKSMFKEKTQTIDDENTESTENQENDISKYDLVYIIKG